MTRAKAKAPAKAQDETEDVKGIPSPDVETEENLGETVPVDDLKETEPPPVDDSDEAISNEAVDPQTIRDEEQSQPQSQVSQFSGEPATNDEQEAAFWSAIAETQTVANPSIDEAIQRGIADALAKLGLDKLVGASSEPKEAFVAPKFKYHFRCDVSPHLKIQAMDMSALDRGERPQDNPLIGHWYEFHVGHFQTNDENAAKQLHWMMGKVSVDSAGQTVGGNQSIYEDDGSVVYRCPNCDFVTASPNGYKAHRQATHGEVI